MKRAAIILALAALGAGCATAPRTTRSADPAGGDFYTNEEIKGLSQEQRDRYCAALDAEIVRAEAETARLRVTADSLQSVADSLKTANGGITSQIQDIDAEVRQLRLARRSASSYLVKAGDTLQKVSESVYGTSDRWKAIYEANKDRVKDPNAPLQPGIRLTIPSK
jgi:nucleoid-associated protein YgaU